LNAHPVSLFDFPLQAQDVPGASNVARELLPDDDEASERYNSGQEAFAAGAFKNIFALGGVC
jgi:hypothetical protein